MTDSGASDDESARKDALFGRLAALSDEMIAAFGEDFTMGALLLAARYIAGRQAKTKPPAPAAPA